MEYRALGNSNLDDGTVKGDRREAACMAWFPAGRELYPVSVKFKGDDGEVICVRNINISSSEDILCNGIRFKAVFMQCGHRRPGPGFCPDLLCQAVPVGDRIPSKAVGGGSPAFTRIFHRAFTKSMKNKIIVDILFQTWYPNVR